MAASAGTIQVGVKLTGDQARVEALDRSVRVSLANGGNEKTEATIARAGAYLAFLTDDA